MGALNMVGRHGQAQRPVMRSGKSVPQASYYAFLAPKNVSMKDGNRSFGYRVIKLAINGCSSYMFLVRPAWPLIISLLISSPYYSLKIFETLFESPKFRCYYLPLKKLKIGNNRKLFDPF